MAAECASYVGDAGAGHPHRGARGQSQMRYAPYDVPTGVLSPPPDYGNTFKDLIFLVHEIFQII